MTFVDSMQTWIHNLRPTSLLIIGILTAAGFYTGKSVKYIKLPATFGDDIVNAYHYRLAVKMMSFAGSVGCKAFGIEYLEAITGLHRRTVVEGLKTLQELGYIKRRPKENNRQNVPYLYDLDVHGRLK